MNHPVNPSGGSREMSAHVAPLAWMDAAACAEADPDLWHPTPGASGRPAVTICGGCPVRTPCLQYALDHERTWGSSGIYGGLTPDQRHRLKKGRVA